MNDKCFSKDCTIIGGNATDSELFASVARGGAIAGRLGREKQMENLTKSAMEIAKICIERINLLGSILFSLVFSLVGPIISEYLVGLVWWLFIITIVASFAFLFFIVYTLNFLRTLIIKITFSKHLTIKIIKRDGLSAYDELTIDDINKVIKEQYIKVIIDKYNQSTGLRYKYKRINGTDLDKRNIRFRGPF